MGGFPGWDQLYEMEQKQNSHAIWRPISAVIKSPPRSKNCSIALQFYTFTCVLEGKLIIYYAD